MITLEFTKQGLRLRDAPCRSVIDVIETRLTTGRELKILYGCARRGRQEPNSIRIPKNGLNYFTSEGRSAFFTDFVNDLGTIWRAPIVIEAFNGATRDVLRSAPNLHREQVQKIHLHRASLSSVEAFIFLDGQSRHMPQIMNHVIGGSGDRFSLSGFLKTYGPADRQVQFAYLFKHSFWQDAAAS